MFKSRSSFEFGVVPRVSETVKLYCVWQYWQHISDPGIKVPPEDQTYLMLTHLEWVKRGDANELQNTYGSERVRSID